MSFICVKSYMHIICFFKCIFLYLYLPRLFFKNIKNYKKYATYTIQLQVNLHLQYKIHRFHEV